ncbi:MAG: restriction endonuclease subunit S [Vicinamibacterales bacterium]
MCEWRCYDVSALLADGKLVIGDGYRAKNSELSRSGLPFARAGNINSGFQFGDADCFPIRDIVKVGNKVSQPGDVVFTSKGTVGRFALVSDTTPRFVYSPQLCFWRSCDQGLIDSRFLYYWMYGSEFFVQFKGVAGQTDMAEYVSLTDQRRMSITLPPEPEQRAIAHILGTLDGKIELNRRMSETLEAMARALFKSWFVDFDPVRAKAEGRDPGLPTALADLFPDSFEDSELGEIPKGWRVGTIGSIADVIDCLHSRKPERRESGLPLLQLSNIRDDGLVDMRDVYLIDGANYQKWVSRMEASPGDCLITNVGRVGAVAQMPTGQKAALGRNMTGIRCKPTSPFPTFLIECLLSGAMKDEMALNTDTGTILDALNVRSIPRLRFSRPSAPNVLESFERLVRPLRAQMESNLVASQTLAALRDTLLPKLISGELRVPLRSAS